MMWLFIVILVAVDQLTKYLVVQNLGPKDFITVIPNFFEIIYRENRGAAWSLLADANWGIYVLRIISLLAAILFCFLLTKIKHNWLKVAMVLMIAGTIGNGIDRWLLGYVVDFLSFTFGSYVFPTFNVADSVLVVGTIMFAAGMLFIPHDKQFDEDKKLTVLKEDDDAE